LGRVGRNETACAEAADSPGLFEQRRIKTKLRHLAAEARRLPEAQSLVAAVLGDPSISDDIRLCDRPHAIDWSDGMPREGGVEPQDVGVLHTVLTAVGDNGGMPVRISERGRLDGGLPPVELAIVGHLRGNGLLTNRRDGNSWLCGPGPRVIEIAKRWGIELPDPGE
jgi:hypothetical protein